MQYGDVKRGYDGYGGYGADVNNPYSRAQQYRLPPNTGGDIYAPNNPFRQAEQKMSQVTNFTDAYVFPTYGQPGCQLPPPVLTPSLPSNPSDNVEVHIGAYKDFKNEKLKTTLKTIIGCFVFIPLLPALGVRLLQASAFAASKKLGSLAFGGLGFISSCIIRGAIAASNRISSSQVDDGGTWDKIKADTENSARVGGNITGAFVGVLLAIGGGLVKIPSALVAIAINDASFNSIGGSLEDVDMGTKFDQIIKRVISEVAFVAESFGAPKFNEEDKDKMFFEPLKETFRELKNDIETAGNFIRSKIPKISTES